MLSARSLAVNGLAPFDFHIDAGECIALTGASGSGKTLVLRALADLDPCAGDVALDGRHREAMPAPDWRRQVAFLTAEPGWWEDRIAAHFPTDGSVAVLLDVLGLSPDLLDQTVATASTGERQRLALIRVLLLNPRVLLLDEPTSGLDEAAAERVEGLLAARLADGASILLVTHDPGLARRLAHRCLHIADGIVGPQQP